MPCREFSSSSRRRWRGSVRLRWRGGFCRCAGQLQRGDYFCVGGRWGKILAALVARRGRIGVGFWLDEFLSFARGLRATLGEYRAGAFVGLASVTKLSLHSDRRSGTQLIQLDCVERGDSADGDDGDRR